jgi:chromosome segregation ATPase
MNEQNEAVGTDVGNTAGGTTQNLPDLSGLMSQLEKANAALAEKEAQYKGLQKTYNTLFESSKSLRTEHESLTADSLTLKNQLEALEGDQGTFKSQFETLRDENAKLETKLQQLESKSARTDLIIQDYPELLPFEAKGLLPTVEEGPGNTGGGTTPEPKRADVLSKMMRIAGNSEKVDEYRQLQTQLDELDAKKE